MPRDMTHDVPLGVPGDRSRRSFARWLVPACLGVAGWFIGAGLAGGEASADNGGQPPLPAVTMAIGEHVLRVELAVEPEQRYLGLGNRRTLAEDAGMLFVYPEQRPLTFTMRDTLLPLSIAYIDDTLTLLEIVDMNVGPGQLFPSAQPARYALEVNQGWFDARDIEPGARLELVDGELQGTLDGALR